MRRRRWHRFVCALLAVWLSATMAELPGLDACPMHGAGSMRMDAMAHAGMMMGGGEMVHPAVPAQHGKPGGSGCTCPGTCCAACGSMPLASESPGGPLPAPVAADEPAGGTAFGTHGRQARLLPFANGPPAALS